MPRLDEEATMPRLDEELSRLVSEAVQDAGCNLYHTEIRGKKLEIYIDKRGGAKLGDCEQVSRALTLAVAAARDEWRKLTIDVSTPGIERRLYEPAHYRSAIGERVEVKTDKELITGRLTSADDEGIIIEAGVSRRVKYNEILTAQVKRTTEELFKRK